MTHRYRSKPVEIEAARLKHDNGGQVEAWINQGGFIAALLNNGKIEIYTLEGTMTADVGDYIIRGTIGEFYPCKPAVFEAKYERV